ncbi:MAG: response regulator [Blastocatellia bacterium]|nr:response regulator [Blastocatellia bacterium]
MGLFDKVRAVSQQMSSMLDDAKVRREIDRFEKELLENPESVFAMQQLSDLYQENKQNDKAVGVLCQAAEIHRTRKEYDLALAFFRKAERLGNSDQRLQILRQLVDLSIQLKRYDDAYQRMRNVLELLIARQQTDAAAGMLAALPPLGPKDAQFRKELVEMVNLNREEWAQGARGTWVIEGETPQNPEVAMREREEKFPDHTLLLVDDEPGVLQLLQAAFNRLGCKIHTANNGEEAFELATVINPTLIISDLLMPKMDGSQLFAQLRRHPTLKNVPFVCLTSRGQEMERISALDRGVEDYWIKPFSIAELTIRVRHLLKRIRRPVDMSGQLAQIALPELLQLLEGGRKTGILSVKYELKEAILYFDEGNVVHAELGDIQGDMVIYKIVYWMGGEFAFRSVPVTREKTVTLNTQQLLMEAFRRFDEINRASDEDFPDKSLTYMCSDEIDKATMELEFVPYVTRIKKLFNGRRTLQECVNELTGELETVVLIGELFKQGLLVPGEEITL